MVKSGKDRVELMKSLSISVIDGAGGDNLGLSRNGIIIPFNITNFMLFDESRLVDDVLRRFREKQMDFPNVLCEDDKLKQFMVESCVYHKHDLEDIKSKQYRENNIDLKKKIIRYKLIEKGLMCSDVD